MDRRFFVSGGLALAAVAGTLPARAAASFVDYAPGVIENALKEGRTVFVDYAAWWCTTCRAQGRVIERLTAANPAYARAMLFVRVDWDNFKREPVTVGRNVPRRSTLLVLRGDRELGRIVAGTSEAEIKALLDRGL